MCVRIRSFCKYITKWTCHCLALLLYIYIILKTQTFFNQPYMYISCNTVDTGLIITYFIRNRTISGRLTIRKTNRNTSSLKFVIHFRESYGEIRSSYRHTAPLSVLPQVQTGSVVTCMAGVSASTIQPLYIQQQIGGKTDFQYCLFILRNLTALVTERLWLG